MNDQRETTKLHCTTLIYLQQRLSCNVLLMLLQPSDLPQTLCDEGIIFVEVSEANAAALREEAQSAYDELSENETTEDFITRIQELKDDQGEVPAPASPEDCTRAAG